MIKKEKNKKKRILLVEDDEPTRESIILKFKKAKIETDFAENGHSGLEKLHKDRNFDLILLDLRMPKGDGFWFLEWKKDDQFIKHIPVVIITNFSQPEFVKRALELGVVGYLVKANHSLDDIIKEVKKCLKNGKCQIDY